ncbi:DNA-binding transcriptional activator GcvA [compost metagenome]
MRYKAPADAVTFNQVNLVFEAVLQGMGVGLGWEFMVRERIDNGDIYPVSALVVHTGQADYLVHDKQAPCSPAAQVFQGWLLGLN